MKNETKKLIAIYKENKYLDDVLDELNKSGIETEAIKLPSSFDLKNRNNTDKDIKILSDTRSKLEELVGYNKNVKVMWDLTTQFKSHRIGEKTKLYEKDDDETDIEEYSDTKYLFEHFDKELVKKITTSKSFEQLANEIETRSELEYKLKKLPQILKENKISNIIFDLGSASEPVMLAYNHIPRNDVGGVIKGTKEGGYNRDNFSEEEVKIIMKIIGEAFKEEPKPISKWNKLFGKQKKEEPKINVYFGLTYAGGEFYVWNFEDGKTAMLNPTSSGSIEPYYLSGETALFHSATRFDDNGFHITYYGGAGISYSNKPIQPDEEQKHIVPDKTITGNPKYLAKKIIEDIL